MIISIQLNDIYKVGQNYGCWYFLFFFNNFGMIFLTDIKFIFPSSCLHWTFYFLLSELLSVYDNKTVFLFSKSTNKFSCLPNAPINFLQKNIYSTFFWSTLNSISLFFHSFYDFFTPRHYNWWKKDSRHKLFLQVDTQDGSKQTPRQRRKFS